MKKSIKYIIEGIIGLEITFLISYGIFKLYKFVFINYCLYESSKIILPAKLHMLISTVTIYTLTMGLLHIFALLVALICISVSLIVKRKL